MQYIESNKCGGHNEQTVIFDEYLHQDTKTI